MGTQFEYATSRDRRTRWCHVTPMPGTTPRCLINTEGNVNSLGTRSLVWGPLSLKSSD